MRSDTNERVAVTMTGAVAHVEIRRPSAHNAIDNDVSTPLTMRMRRKPKVRSARITNAFMLKSPANNASRYSPE